MAKNHRKAISKWRSMGTVFGPNNLPADYDTLGSAAPSVQQLDIACEMLGEGARIMDVCMAIGVRADVLWNALLTQRSEQYARARELRGLLHVESIEYMVRAALDGSIPSDRLRVAMQGATWLAERMCRVHYGPVVQRAQERDDATSEALQGLGAAALRAALAQIARSAGIEVVEGQAVPLPAQTVEPSREPVTLEAEPIEGEDLI